MTAAELLVDEQALYRAVSARDRRFDGQFVFGVTSTGIYCRPSCPARTPKQANVRYFSLPAAAAAAGFRSCKRCRPDKAGRVWNPSGDLTARALRLVGDGMVDEVGVTGLARELAVSERHLTRTLTSEVGIGPLALARARRAQTARLLLEQTDLTVTDVAFAAGFASLRQFNDVIRTEFGATPTELRKRRTTPDRPAESGTMVLRLAPSLPWDGSRLVTFLSTRAIPGVEAVGDFGYRRALQTKRGPVYATLKPLDDALHVEFRLPHLGVLQPAVVAVRRLFDLDADTVAIDAALSADPALAPLVGRRPGLRVPGAVDGFEILVRAVVGQQVSVAGARTMLGRIVERVGDVVSDDDGSGISRLFPTAEQLADADLTGLGLTTRRMSTLRAVAEAVARRQLRLRPGLDREAVTQQLLEMPGIGPWTAEYVAMRALADPDAFPSTDLVVKRRVSSEGLDPDRWRPWRAYAAIHLWTDEAETTK
jgi:AraC family transcriptional regulator of adaptative response / DNA-3-methyladenine glycosylase II